MKKALSLLLALVLCLSLCACGGNESTDIPADTNSTADAVMTKEEMLENAQNLNYFDFEKNVTENMVRAEEMYVGNIFKMAGFVTEINDNGCVLSCLNTSNYLSGYIHVPLTRKELMNLNVNERIVVVGEISEITKGSVKFGSAYYVSNEFEGTVKIYSVLYASASDSLPIYATASYVGIMDENPAPMCNVYLDGSTLATLKKDDEITITGKVVMYDRMDEHMYYNQKILFKIQDAKISN